MKKRRITRIILFFLLIAFGASCFLVFQPWLMREGSRRKAASDADAFLQHYEPSSTLPDVVGATSEPITAAEEPPRGELYGAMQAYNKKIAAEGQEGLCDPWAYTVPAIDLSTYGLDADEAIAVLQIPSINVRLPIYSGASTEHLNKGAALLSQTSFPIGGTDTNSVIGAHRGWNAKDYLRDIEDVQIGDEVTVTNFWQELHYSVAEIKIIRPNEISQILIRPGCDLLTVFTCHPYASGGKYRYLLICERATEAAGSTGTSNTETTNAAQSDHTAQTEEPTLPASQTGSSSVPSATDEIRLVAILPWIGLAALIILSVFMLLYLRNKSGKPH